MSYKLLISCVFLSLFFFAEAQNSPEYFKVYPKIKESEPLWVKLMYSSDPDVEEVVELYNSYYSSHKFVKNIHTQNYKYWLRNIKELVAADGHILNPESPEYRNRIEMLHKQKIKFSKSKTGGTTWISVGPFQTYRNNGSGNLRTTQANVYAIGVAPSNHNIVLHHRKRRRFQKRG